MVCLDFSQQFIAIILLLDLSSSTGFIVQEKEIFVWDLTFLSLNVNNIIIIQSLLRNPVTETHQPFLKAVTKTDLPFLKAVTETH